MKPIQVGILTLCVVGAMGAPFQQRTELEDISTSSFIEAKDAVISNGRKMTDSITSSTEVALDGIVDTIYAGLDSVLDLFGRAIHGRRKRDIEDHEYSPIVKSKAPRNNTQFDITKDHIMRESKRIIKEVLLYFFNNFYFVMCFQNYQTAK